MDEINDIGNVIANIIDNKGEDKRNFFGILRAQRGATDLYNISGDSLNLLNEAYKSNKIGADEYKEGLRNIIEATGNDLGLNVSLVYLDTSTMPKDSEGSTGSSYIVDRKNRKVLISIDVNKIEDIKELLGTLTEEVAHGKDALEGRQDKKVAEDKSNDEEGLETLGRPANEYVKKKFGEDNNSKIKLTTDGIDLTNADVGEKVGDDLDSFEEDQYYNNKGYKKDDGSFEVIVTPKKGESEAEAITNGHYKIKKTDDFLYAQEGDNPKKISELSGIAKIKSEIDPYNNYIVTVSREEGINILAVPKAKSLKENQSKDFHEAVGNIAKSNKKVAENLKNGKYLSAVGNGIISVLNVPNLIQTGIGSTTADLEYSFDPGEVQYGKKKDILGRREANKVKAKGTTDSLVSIAAASVMPNKIGGGTITVPSTAQAVVATGEVVGTAGKVITLPTLGTGGAQAMLIASGVGSNLKDSDKVDDISNEKQEKSITKEKTNKKVNDTQSLGNKNGDLYYEGRKTYTAKELNQMGRVKGGSPNRGVEYVYESPAGKQKAQEFQWGTEHSMMQNTPAGKKNVVPVLRYDNPNTRGMNFIKFDGIEVENGVTYLIDAKTDVPYWSKSGMEKIKGTLGRISEAKKQNPGIKVIYEFPNETAAGHLRSWIDKNNFYDGIVEIRVRK